MSRKKKKAKDAFLGSERHALEGVKLEPWTPDRSIAAQSLGLRYPNLGEEGWTEVKRAGTYPGVVRDVCLALWLCTLKPEQVLEAETRGEQEAKKKSTEWAAKLGIHDTKKQAFWDGLNKCMEMWNEVNQSVTVPAKAEPNDDDESGND